MLPFFFGVAAVAAAQATIADGDSAHAAVRNLTSALCGSTCADVWLDPSGAPQIMGAIENARACFALINQTCWDCTKQPPPPASFPEAVCVHNLFRTDSQPISGAFIFCSGHSAASAEGMSHVAWRRFIGWRSDTCADDCSQPMACPRRRAGNGDGSEYDALVAARPQTDAQTFHRFYKAETTGWTAGMEAQLGDDALQARLQQFATGEHTAAAL